MVKHVNTKLVLQTTSIILVLELQKSSYSYYQIKKRMKSYYQIKKMMKFFVESFNKEHQRSTHTCGDRVSGEKRRLLPTLLHCHAAQQAVGTVQPKRQWRRAVAQWEGLSAAPVGVKGMHPFPLLLPRTLALGSHPRPGPGSARCTGAQRLPEIQILGRVMPPSSHACQLRSLRHGGRRCGARPGI